MDNEKQHDPWCSKCIYYGRSTRTCDYILMEDQRRPCPAGDGCTARRTSRKVSKMGKPRWDTELGRLLWLDGKSDREIAVEMGVATNTVLHQRKTKWEKGTARPEPKEAPLRWRKCRSRSRRNRLSSIRQNRKLQRTAWPRWMVSTIFWRKRQNPSMASKQYARQMQFFACGIGAVQTICAGHVRPLPI